MKTLPKVVVLALLAFFAISKGDQISTSEGAGDMVQDLAFESMFKDPKTQGYYHQSSEAPTACPTHHTKHPTACPTHTKHPTTCPTNTKHPTTCPTNTKHPTKNPT